MGRLLSSAPAQREKMKCSKGASQQIFEMGRSSSGCLLPAVSAGLNRILISWFPDETLLLMPLQRCRMGQLVPIGGKSLAFKSEEQQLMLSYDQTPNFFPSFFPHTPSIFFFFVCAKYIPQHLHASPWTFQNSKGSRNDSKLLSMLSKECKSGNLTLKAWAGKSILPVAKHFTSNIFEPAYETISFAKTTFPH